MIGKILHSILQEVKALQSDTGAQCLMKVNFKPSRLPDYTMPLVILDMEDGNESLQFPGGLSLLTWRFGFSSYNYEPDAYVDDNTPYSTSLLYDPIDKIRRHFSLNPLGKGVFNAGENLTVGIIYQVQGNYVIYNTEVVYAGNYFIAVDGQLTFTSPDIYSFVAGTSWLTEGMVEIFNLYGCQFTFMGINTADQIDNENLVMGYKIQFDSTSFDSKTEFTDQSVPLQTITQISNPPFTHNFLNTTEGGYLVTLSGNFLATTQEF